MAGPTYRKVGSSRTLPGSRGKTIAVSPPDDTAYLCALICQCNGNPTISSGTRELRQRCATMRVRNDCDAHEQVWKYKGEVGYNMMNQPPSPIMANLKPNLPVQFPLGVDRKDLKNAFELASLTGRFMKGLLRIVDVVIVQDRDKFDLGRSNMECVVKIRYPGERWQREQERDYVRIAGNPENLKLLSPADCECKACAKSDGEPATGTLPQKAVVQDMSMRRRQVREHNALVDRGAMPGPRLAEPTALADVLRTGATDVEALAIAFATVAQAAKAPELLVDGVVAIATAQ